MANLYQKKVIPVMYERKFATKEIEKYRKELLSNVTGEILEIGIGTGSNLMYYPKEIKHITSVDEIVLKLKTGTVEVDQYYNKLSELVFEDNSFDTVVMCFSMSQIADLKSCIMEVKRVLKPRGRLLFMDHGLALKKRTQLIQKAMSPVYEVAQNRYLNRDYFSILKEFQFLFAKESNCEVEISPKELFGTLYIGVAMNSK